jgi:hypothetical protein
MKNHPKFPTRARLPWLHSVGLLLPFECEGKHVTPVLWVATLKIVYELSVVITMESKLFVMASVLQTTSILQHLVVNVANLHHQRVQTHNKLTLWVIRSS